MVNIIIIQYKPNLMDEIQLNRDGPGKIDISCALIAGTLYYFA